MSEPVNFILLIMIFYFLLLAGTTTGFFLLPLPVWDLFNHPFLCLLVLGLHVFVNDKIIVQIIINISSRVIGLVSVGVFPLMLKRVQSNFGETNRGSLLRHFFHELDSEVALDSFEHI